MKPHRCAGVCALKEVAVLALLWCWFNSVEGQESAPEAPLPPGAVARLQHSNFWHGAAVRGLAFSSDETMLATLGSDGRIALWDVATGKPRRRWNTPRPNEDAKLAAAVLPSMNLFFSGDGSTLGIVDSTGRTCRLWNSATGAEIAAIPLNLTEDEVDPPVGVPVPAKKVALAKRAVPGAFALSHDGKLFASEQIKDHAIHVVTPGRKEPLWKLPGPQSRVTALAFSANGKTLASAAENQTIRLWSLDDGKPARAFTGHRAAIVELTFSPKQDRLLSASADGSLRLWDVATGRSLVQVAWKPPQLFETGNDATIASARIVATTLQQLWFDADGQGFGAFYSIAFGTTGVSEDGIVRFDADGKQLVRAVVHDHRATSAANLALAAALASSRATLIRTAGVAFAPGRNVLARPTTSYHVQLVNMATGQPLGVGLTSSCTELGMAGDTVAVVQQGDPAIYLWRWKAKEPLRKLTGHTGNPSLVGFGPKGAALVSASHAAVDHSLSVWDVAKAVEVRQIVGWNPGVAALTSANPFASRAAASSMSMAAPVLSPDGSRLALRGADGKLRVVDVATGADVAAPVFSWKGDGCVAFSADGKRLVISDAVDARRTPGFVAKAAKAVAKRDAGSHLYVLDLESGKAPRRINLDSFEFPIARVVVSGRHALVGCLDGGVRLINLDTGRTVHDVWQAEGKNPAGAAAFSAVNRIPLFAVSRDGRMVALRSPEDGATRIMEVASGKVRLTLPSQEAVVTCLAFAQDGLHAVTGSQNSAVLVWGLGASSPATLADAEKPAVWQALGGDDAERAFATMRRLLGNPAGAVDMIRAHVLPVPPLAEAIVRKRIRELDSPMFATRQKAQDALIELGDPVREYLTKAAEDKDATSELKQRSAAILRRLDEASPTIERLRELRALELLERLATSDARQVLQSLARGAAGAALTLEARASLDRLHSADADAPRR